MKNIKIFFLFVLAVGCLGACDEDITKAKLKTDVAPNELLEPSADSYTLTMEDKAKVMETFEWTTTDFGFDASTTYTLQFDRTENNFADAVDILTVNNLLEADVNTGAFNDLLLAADIAPEEATQIEIRVVSKIYDRVEEVYSNVRTIEVSTYATSFSPIYGMGNALKGWGPDKAVEWQSGEYKKYSTITYLTQGQAFRWFAKLDSEGASYNYPFFTTVSSVFENAGDADSNLKVAGATGWYKVDIDLTTKVVTADGIPEPIMYMTGAGIGGWDEPGTGVSIKMTYIKPGVFQASAPFVQGGTWRFFPHAGWGESYNYPFFTGGVPTYFENANDDDKNFKVVGASATLKVTVDVNAKTVTLGDPVLYVTGDDFGWNWTTGYEQLVYNPNTSAFTLTTDLTNNALFRFFPQKDWSPAYNYGYFKSIDAQLANQGAGTDQNFRYTGTTGSRTIVVSVTGQFVYLY